MKKKIVVTWLLTLLIIIPAIGQKVGLRKIFTPLPTSFYNAVHFADDNINFFDDVVIFGKREAPARGVAKKVAKEEETVAFDATNAIEDVLEYIDNPNTLIFKNGKAFIEMNDKVRFLTEVQITGINTITPETLRKELELFSAECLYQGFEPDLIEVDFSKNAQKYSILAIKLTPEGKVTLYERINPRTTKISKIPTDGIFAFGK